MREMEYPSYASTAGPKLQWSAIIAGTVMSFVVMALLSVLGVGIGFLAAPAADTGKGLAMGMGIGGSLWLLIGGIVSFYCGGWFASRLSQSGRPADGVLYGLVSWGTATLMAAFLFTSAIGSVLGTAFGSAASGAAQGASVAAQDRRGGESVQERMRSAGRELRDQARQTAGEPRRVDRAEAAETAETASKTAGAVGLFGFVTMLLQGIAAAFGGRAGARLYLPVPIGEYRGSRERETVSIR